MPPTPTIQHNRHLLEKTSNISHLIGLNQKTQKTGKWCSTDGKNYQTKNKQYVTARMWKFLLLYPSRAYQ